MCRGWWKVKQKCFALKYEKIGNAFFRGIIKVLRQPIERLVGFHLLNDIYERAQTMPKDIPFERRVLDVMDVKVAVDDMDMRRIPCTGAVAVVSNHPFGGIEGVALLERLKTIRPDVKAMANYMLSTIAEMKDDFFAVDPFARPGAVKSNLRPLKECMQWLADGHVLIIFPAGEVAHFSCGAGCVRESEWKRNIGELIGRSNAPVVPVWFKGRNSWLFNLAGLVHPMLRTMLLPREFANKRGSVISMSVGNLVTAVELQEYRTPKGRIADYLRFRAELLNFRDSRAEEGGEAPDAARFDDIIAAADAGEISAEIDSLPEDTKMAESATEIVYAVRAGQIPMTMREIGRLREIAFRAAGEGSGRGLDIDAFDEYYVHLVLWNKKSRMVTGGYRMGMVDEITASRGVRGLYTSTLFEYRRRLRSGLSDAIELGRSFVRTEYQRSATSLFMLWKGIAGYIAANPRYRRLIGPVSISAVYSPAAKSLMAMVLLQRSKGIASGMLRPRNRFRPMPDMARFVRANAGFLNDDAVFDKAVRELDYDGRGLPVLFRQYLKLNGVFLAFNVDVDFSSVVDGFVVVDMMKIEPKALRRYMGDVSADAYRQVHQSKHG